MLDLPIPEQVQGLDLSRAARNETGAPSREWAYAEKNYTNYYDPSRMVRTKECKYIRKGLRTCIYDFQIPEIELSSWGFRQHHEVFSFYSAERCTEELYDLTSDPGEMTNVAGHPAYTETLDGMRDALDAHLAETADPFADLNNGLLMPARDYVVLQNCE